MLELAMSSLKRNITLRKIHNRWNQLELVSELISISFYSTKTGVFFARYSGNTKQGFVRDFELDHFLTQLDEKNSELGNFYLILL